MALTGTVLATGDTLGGYRVLDVIGLGGMAIVYRAHQLSLGREVALKLLAPELADDEEFRTRFRRECHHIAALDHPHVVPVYDFGEVDGRLFLAMRLVRGVTLEQRMRRGALTAEETVSLLSPIARALDAARAAELVHRDVKPQNILIGDEAHPYLADFGVAKGVTTTGGTITSGFVGTCNYAAPEQVLGRPVTPAVDVYGLTAVLCQCLTGQVPFPRETDAGVLHAHVYEPPPVVDPGLPGAALCDRLLARGLAKDPVQRCPTAGELMRETGRLVAELPVDRRAAAPPFGVALGRRARALPSVRTTTSPAAGQPPSRPVPVHSLGWRLGASLAVIVAAAVATTVILSGGASAVRGDQSARAAPFTLDYSRPWHTVTAAAGDVTGRQLFARGDVLQLTDGTSNLSAGRLAVSASVPGGVAPGLMHRYGRPAGSAAMTLAGHAARMYRWSTPGEMAVADVLPLAGGDAAILCAAPSGAAAALRACGALAQRVTAPGAPVIAPGPDRVLGATVARSLHTVRIARVRATRVGGPLGARAPALGAAAATEARAAAALAHRAAPLRYDPVVDALVAGLRGEAGVLRALSGAGRHNASGRYGREIHRVAAASHRLAAAAGAAAGVGLTVIQLGTLHLPGLPASTSTGSTSTGSTSLGSSTSGSSAQGSTTSAPPSGTGSTQSAPVTTTPSRTQSSPPPAKTVTSQFS